MVPQETYIARRKLAVVLRVSLEQVNYCIKALVDKRQLCDQQEQVWICLSARASRRCREVKARRASIASKLDENNAPHEEINALVEWRGC